MIYEKIFVVNKKFPKFQLKSFKVIVSCDFFSNRKTSVKHLVTAQRKYFANRLKANSFQFNFANGD